MSTQQGSRQDARALTLQPVRETEGGRQLRAEVRRFVDEARESGAFVPRVDGWMTGWDPAFSRHLAERGWLGMTIPTEFGGQGRSFSERHVVTEELLAAGAPIAAHWVADRQAAPNLLAFGTVQQKQTLLPRIAAGEAFFCIGMSEPGAGSDLASVTTSAVPTSGGWTITGQKVWTTGAQAADYMVVLARTAPLDPVNRHAGLGQFIVDLSAPGVDVRPIRSIDGLEHFNEVFLDGVHVEDAMVLGQVGEGWTQVTAELAFERSGPERYMSTMVLLDSLGQDRGHGADVGHLAARFSALHSMSASVAAALSRGDSVDVAAAAVKVLGTTAEADLVNLAWDIAATSDSASLLEQAGSGIALSGAFTLRGGANEILRGVIARGMGLR